MAFRILAGIFGVLVCVLLVNAGLSVTLLKRLYVESIASQYSVFGNYLRRNIETGLFFEKPLGKFVGMDALLGATQQHIRQNLSADLPETAVSVSLALPEGLILYSTDEKLVSTLLPEQARTDYGNLTDESSAPHQFQYTTYQEQYLVTLPVHGARDTWAGTIMIAFDQVRVDPFLKTVTKESVLVIGMILGGSLLLLFPLLRLMLRGIGDARQYPRTRLVLLLIGVVIAAQLMFWVMSANSFKNHYLRINREKADTLTALLKDDIEYLLSKGVPVNQLIDIERLMAEVIVAFPELQSMTILDESRNPLYIATNTEVFDFRNTTDDQLESVYAAMPVFDRDYNLSVELTSGENTAGYISVNLSKAGILATLLSKGARYSNIVKIALGVTIGVLLALPLLYEVFLHTKVRLVASACLVLLLALGFNGLLHLNSLEKLYVNSIAAQYAALGKNLRQNFEKALFFEKPLHKFVGIDRLLEETKENMLQVRFNGHASGAKPLSLSEVAVSVALPDGSILYSTEESLVGTVVPEQVRTICENASRAKDAPRDTGYVKHDNHYLVPLPVYDGQQGWVASVIIHFNGRPVALFLEAIRHQNMRLLTVIFGVSTIVLIVLLDLITWKNTRTKSFPKVKIALAMLVVVGSAQIVFSMLNTYRFRNYYLRITQHKAAMLLTMVRDDIEFFCDQGIPLEQLVNMDGMLEDFLGDFPELQELVLIDTNSKALYMADRTDRQGVEPRQYAAGSRWMLTDSPYHHRLELMRNGVRVGALLTTLSKKTLSGKLFDTLLDSATVLAISLLFFGELLFLSIVYIERDFISREEWSASHHYGAIRPAAFLLLFGASVSISFLPLYMASLYKPMLNLSKDMIMGLPISVKMFFTGISIFIGGVWLDRRGWHEPFLTGLALTGAGLFCSWMAPDAFWFILSRGLVGLGYGFALMACQGFVIANTDKRNRTQGLTQLFAGVFAGSICGGAAGGMLAERIGYRGVFFLGALIVLAVIGYTMLFMRDAVHQSEPGQKQQSRQRMSPKQIVGFLLHKSVLPLIVFASLPAALVIVGFLNYFSPVYLHQIGTSASNIGRILMLHGICLIYLAPFMSKYIDASSNKKQYIFINCFVGSLAFILFYFLRGISASLAAVLLLGLSDSFSDSRSSYLLKLKVTQELGIGKAMGLFSSVARIGQVLGPITFAWLIVTAGIDKSILYIGCVYLLMACLFFLFTPDDSKFNAAEN